VGANSKGRFKSGPCFFTEDGTWNCSDQRCRKTKIMRIIFIFFLILTALAIIGWFYWPLIVAIVLLLAAGYLFSGTEQYKKYLERKK
jgi:Flp pilus assembly protein TadB